MNEFYKNLINKLGEDNFKKVQATRVGLAGLGGLGSNCALNLVRVGFRKFTMVDFDSIDSSNLDRQFYFFDQVGEDKTEALKANLLKVNPDLEIKALKARIEKGNVEEIFGSCRVVAECFDKAESKSMLVAELLRLKKFVVSASGLGGWGESDEIKTHRVKGNLIMVGDLRSDICMRPALSPRVNIAASKQADAILEYTIGK
ncbi:MAG: sulfur carrier protein ThiS adenylyltransferase ThiF [Candidatus Omnitrophota bacterium]|nr:sulfur carrier protein ThiS adenylyltransferase ThiF [Candidatus Omnitrophota bacterium]